MITIAGPILLLAVIIWVVVRSRRRQPGEASPEQVTERRPSRSTRKRNAPAKPRKATPERIALPDAVERWFAQRGWAPRRHQLEMLGLAARAEARCSSLRPAPARPSPVSCRRSATSRTNPAEGLHTLYVSPLKALAVDVQRNLLGPIEEMGLPIRVETRSGDTPSDRKARQRIRPPQILLTTPESLEPAAQLSRQRDLVRRPQDRRRR